MLKVTIVETRNQRRRTLEGALVQPWVEKPKGLAAAIDDLPARQLVVDLDNTTRISKEVLSDFMRQGARFLCAGFSRNTSSS
jgi:hypothetical protein